MGSQKLCTKTTDKTDMGKRLAHLIEANGFSVASFARAAGLRKQTLYAIMYDKHQPRLDTLKLIADALHISLSQFFAETLPDPVERPKIKIQFKAWQTV